MESLKKYIELENLLNLGITDTNTKPPEQIINIFNAVKEEIKAKVSKKIENIKGYEIDNKEIILYLGGGAISDLFIPEYKEKPKDYNFFILEESYAVNRDGLTVYGNMKDIVISTFTKEIKDGMIKMIRCINGEEIKITINFVKEFAESFDLAFREFYYKGNTIEASFRAIRDIENKQISINSLISPLETYYRLREYEERYNMTAAPIEKFILLKYLDRKRVLSWQDPETKGKWQFYTEKREEECRKEIEDNFLERDIYSYMLDESLRDNYSFKPEIFEKARIMYEKGIIESELTEPFDIEIPNWNCEETSTYLYDKVKNKMAIIIKKYNTKVKLEELYSEPRKLRFPGGKWLKGEVTNDLIEKLKDDIIVYTTKNSEESIKSYYERIIEKLRYKLFLDNEFSFEQKIVSTEMKESDNFGDQKETIKLIETGKLELKIYYRNFYSKGVISQQESEFIDKEYLAINAKGILIKYFRSGKIVFYKYNELINNERKEKIEKELKVYLKEWNKN